MTKKYHNEHAEAVHSAAQGMFKVGAITKKEMNEYDEMCLVKEDKPAKKIHLFTPHAGGLDKRTGESQSQGRHAPKNSVKNKSDSQI